MRATCAGLPILSLMQNETRDDLALTVPEVARTLRVSVSAVLDLLRRGELPFARVGRSILIPTQAVGVFLEARTRRVPPLDRPLRDDDPAVRARSSVRAPADQGDGHGEED